MPFLFVLIVALSFILTNTAKAEPILNPHFFEITKKGKTHYLLGTMHYAVRFSDFTKPVKESFSKSKSLITEVSYKDSQKESIWKKLSDMKLPPLPKLKDGHVEKLRRLGVSDKLLPRSDSSDADLYIFFPFQGDLPYYILDMDMYFQAKENGKIIKTLDTDTVLKESKKFGNSHTSALTIGYVLDTMSEAEIHDWGKRSIDSYLKDPGHSPISTDGGIIYRNKQWLPKLLNYYQNSNLSFTTVGAAHLYGKIGLLELLKSNGYTIKQLGN